MIIQYASDLHPEFRSNSEYLAQHPLKVVGDILVLAGDIILLDENKLEKHPFFQWCADNFKETLIIPGNHEYYAKHDVADTLTDYEYQLHSNVKYVNNKNIKLNDATELFLTTLWSPVGALEQMPVQLGLTDCRRIVYEGRKFNSQDYTQIHNKCFAWLRNAIEQSSAIHKIIITHHCPTFNFKDPRFIESQINSAFCAPLNSFIEQSDIKAWIFGHTHYNGGHSSYIGNTLMLSNQLRYVQYGESKSFADNATLKIDE
jgi:hypothetical protein